MKRAWVILISALALAALLSACGGSDLADELTPIPTLPAGEEPALVEALAGGAESGDMTEEPDEDNGDDTDEDELVALGESLFADSCDGCHGVEDGAGPAFPGMAERAETSVEGMSAEDYLHESIVDPSAHVVEGFADIMPKTYDEQYSDEEIDALVAYIMAESGAEEDDGDTADEGTPEASEAADAGDAETPEATVNVEGDPEAGEALFSASCASCHGANDGAGPALPGMGERAEERVDDMAPEDYLHESIVDPSAFVVPGFSDIMPKTYDEQFSDEEIDDLVAFLLTQ